MSELGDLLLAVHDSLERAQIPHAIGGAIALGYCTLEPRGTRDLDVNVFVGPDRVKRVFAALPASVAFSGLSLEQAERDGQVRVWSGDTPLDLFFSVLPFHEQVAREVLMVPFEGTTIPIVGCTALAVFKAMFDRPRDWVDIEAMVEARAIDLDEAIGWVAEMTGAGAAEVEKLAALRSGSASPSQPSAAERMARKREAWALGGAEGKELDRRRAQGMSYEERIQEGLALVRIAEQLQAGRDG